MPLAPSENKLLKETFICLEATPSESFKSELRQVLIEFLCQLEKVGGTKKTFVSLRFHLSDITNQIHDLKRELENCELQGFISWVGQAPTSGSRVSLEAMCFVYSQDLNFTTGWSSRYASANLSDYRFLWHGNVPQGKQDSYVETQDALLDLQDRLSGENSTVEAQTLRTWIYVRDVDNQYAGVVQARKELFEKWDMTATTHTITSTGIEGQSEDTKTMVKIDSCSILGLEKSQIQYLKALDHLSSTHDYGVTFERGTRVIFGDRSHYFISGTASIDDQGEIVHPGNVVAQTSRALDNIEALLKEGEAELSDLKTITVYLRDSADMNQVAEVIDERLGDKVPRIMVRGPVCRPGWLVEIEGIAVNDKGDERFKPLC